MHKMRQGTSSRPQHHSFKMISIIVFSIIVLKYFGSLRLGHNKKNKLPKISNPSDSDMLTELYHWSSDMLKFDFLRKGLGLNFSPHLSMIFWEKCCSFYILLTDQISFSDCLNFLRYWAIYVLYLFVSQFITS